MQVNTEIRDLNIEYRPMQQTLGQLRAEEAKATLRGDSANGDQDI